MTEAPTHEEPEPIPGIKTETMSSGVIEPFHDDPPYSPTPPTADEDTITFKRSHFFTVLVVLAFVFGLGLGFVIWGRPSPVSTASAPSGSTENEPTETGGASSVGGTTPAVEPTSIPRFDIPLDDDPRMGPDGAEITLVEFSDFECPYCRSFHNETFQRLMETYQGQIQFVYRDFPLTSIHPNAFSAAEAANCAQEQEAYWDYHDLLFSGQLGLGDEAYSGYASQLGLDVEAFEQCLSAGKYTAEVQADYDYAAQLGIRSTPTFFINGLPLVGAQPFEVFSQVIDKELAGEIN
jgi:protein-disulfide isomerase